MKRVLVLSQSFPPQVGGSAILMRNLFKGFPANSYEVISGPRGAKTIDPTEELTVPVHSISYPQSWHRWIYRFEFMLAPFIIKLALRLTILSHFDSIFVNYPSPSFLIAGYYISKKTKLPLDTYMHDLWEENMAVGYRRVLARAFEHRIIEASRTVYGITEEAVAFLSHKHHRPVDILPHPVDLTMMSRPCADSVCQPATILFTGYIYKLMNLDTIQAMVNALNNWERPVKLILVTTVKQEVLGKWGIAGRAVDIRGALSRAETLALQRQAALLYLPLAFDSTSPLEIKTVFPVKATDYMVARRPILVHAPADCHTAQYAQRKGWGSVLNKKDPASIRSAISQLLDDKDIRQQLIIAAENTAAERDMSIISRFLQDRLIS